MDRTTKTSDQPGHIGNRELQKQMSCDSMSQMKVFTICIRWRKPAILRQSDQPMTEYKLPLQRTGLSPGANEMTIGPPYAVSLA